jgi:hypothetical protein
MPKFRAYREAGYTANTQCAAWSGARQLESRQRVKEYIKQVQEFLFIQEQHALENEFLTFDEKRKFLAKVVRTPVGKVDEFDDITSEVKVDQHGAKTIKTPDKLKALELDTRLTGEFKDQLALSISDKVLNFSEEIDV